MFCGFVVIWLHLAACQLALDAGSSDSARAPLQFIYGACARAATTLQIYILFKMRQFVFQGQLQSLWTRRHAPAPWDPVRAPQNVNVGSQLGGHRGCYLLPGIWLKCALFLSLHVAHCGLSCLYLQMWDFTLVGHVNAGCDANWWTPQRESCSLSSRVLLSKGPFVLMSPHKARKVNKERTNNFMRAVGHLIISDTWSERVLCLFDFTQENLLMERMLGPAIKGPFF